MLNITDNRGAVFWLMGPTSSGKTTLAKGCLVKLREKRLSSIHYDGDEVRDFFGDQHGFTEKSRLMVVGTLVYLANKVLEAGMVVLVSALTANRDARVYVTRNVKNLVLVSVECSIEECVRRDPKGLYRAAKEGRINTLIGYNSEYPTVENPDIVVSTEKGTIGQSIDSTFDKMQVILEERNSWNVQSRTARKN